MLVAPAPQRKEPVACRLRAERLHAGHVAWDSVAVEVAPHHRRQPLGLSDFPRACMPDVRLVAFSSRPARPTSAGAGGTSRFPCKECPRIHRVSDCAGSVSSSPLTLPPVLPSASLNSVGDRLQRVVAPPPQRAVDAHQHRLGDGSAVRAVRLAVLPQNHRRPDLPLGEVVLERDLRIVQERKDVIAGATQTLEQPPGVGVVRFRGDEGVQPPIMASASAAGSVQPRTSGNR